VSIIEELLQKFAIVSVAVETFAVVVVVVVVVVSYDVFRVRIPKPLELEAPTRRQNPVPLRRNAILLAASLNRPFQIIRHDR
jgi:hypothetical protein